MFNIFLTFFFSQLLSYIYIFKKYVTLIQLY